MGSALMLWLVVAERPGARDLQTVGHMEMLGVAKSKLSCYVVAAATFMFVNTIKMPYLYLIQIQSI